MLRIVIVLYRSRLRTIRPVLAAVAAAKIGDPVTVNVVINKDGLRSVRSAPHRAHAGGVALEVSSQDNQGGVAAAYNFVIGRSQATDILVLLDADSRLPSDYFSEVWGLRDTLRAQAVFASPELFSGDVRISPYHLSGVVPHVIRTRLARDRLLPFASGIGVINAGLAGSVRGFRTVDGFSAEVGLDLSDVAWSLHAGRRAASLQLLNVRSPHHLSILAHGFGWTRFRKYIVACWRLGIQARDLLGGMRLALRGLRSLRWRRLGG